MLSGDSPVNPGRQRFAFALTTSNGGLVTGGSPEVWVGKEEDGEALGPYTARWHEFTAYEATNDRSPRSALPGTYTAELRLPSTGDWLVAAVVRSSSQRAVGSGVIPVTDDPIPAQLGSKAIPAATPVATTPAGLKRICTRKPPDDMHYISLDDALANGKPTVVSFATPALCESRLCGPVVDEQLIAFRSVGRARANFVHVEIYPGHDPDRPAESFERWGFEHEPWVVVIDRDGVIRARFEGPCVAPEIEGAVRRLL